MQVQQQVFLMQVQISCGIPNTLKISNTLEKNSKNKLTHFFNFLPSELAENH